jgi:RNA polymerase sigma-70 factor (ECF subfamily)
MKMKNLRENTGRMKKAGPTLTPDGKTLLGGKCLCGDSCRNQDDGRAFCRCSHHAAEYREIGELRADYRAEQLRRHMASLLAGPARSELTGVGFNLTRNMGEAEELVQATCSKAFQYAAIYDPRRPLMGWLKTILRNAFIDGKRYARNFVSLEIPNHVGGDVTIGESLADSGVPIEVRMEQEEEAAVLWRAIAELPEAVQRAVSLCDLEGMTYEAAAAQLGVPMGSIRSRISRGRQALREKIQHLTLIP